MFDLSFPKLVGEKSRKKTFHFANVEMTLVPCSVGGAQCLNIRVAVFTDPLRHNFPPRKQPPFAGTQKIITDGPGSSAISFDEWMHPIQPPKAIRRKLGRTEMEPVLMEKRDELIHEMRDFLEMRRNMIPNIDGLFTEPTAELRNSRNSNVIQSP